MKLSSENCKGTLQSQQKWNDGLIVHEEIFCRVVQF